MSLLAILTSCASQKIEPICPAFPTFVETPAEVAGQAPIEYQQDVAENYLRFYQWGSELEALAGCGE